MNDAASAARDKLAADLESVITAAEELLRATSGETKEGVTTARARAEEVLKAARTRLANIDDQVIESAKKAAKAADEFAREHPWGAIGIAAAAGVLVGVILSRR